MFSYSPAFRFLWKDVRPYVLASTLCTLPPDAVHNVSRVVPLGSWIPRVAYW